MWKGGLSMKRAFCLLLLGVLFTACKGDRGPAALEVAPGTSVKISGGNVSDREVEVTGRSVVFVIQNKRVRALIDWPRETPGKVLVPLSVVHDGSSAEMHIGVMKGSLPPEKGDDLCRLLCPNCLRPIECCP
jgi:hypothetical protein